MTSVALWACLWKWPEHLPPWPSCVAGYAQPSKDSCSSRRPQAASFLPLLATAGLAPVLLGLWGPLPSAWELHPDTSPYPTPGCWVLHALTSFGCLPKCHSLFYLKIAPLPASCSTTRCPVHWASVEPPRQSRSLAPGQGEHLGQAGSCLLSDPSHYPHAELRASSGVARGHMVPNDLSQPQPRSVMLPARNARARPQCRPSELEAAKTASAAVTGPTRPQEVRSQRATVLRRARSPALPAREES